MDPHGTRSKQKDTSFSYRVKNILGNKIFYIFEKIFADITYKQLKKEFKKNGIYR